MLIDLSNVEAAALRSALAQDAMTSEARAVLETHLGTGNDHPIQRTYASEHETPSVNLMSVEDLMDENDGFEDSGWQYLTDMLLNGMYDDSDPRGVHCVYLATDRDVLHDQMQAWHTAHPVSTATYNLTMPTRSA